MIFMVYWVDSYTTLAPHFSTWSFTKYVAIVGKEKLPMFSPMFLNTKCFNYEYSSHAYKKPPYSERLNLKDRKSNSLITLH